VDIRAALVAPVPGISLAHFGISTSSRIMSALLNFQSFLVVVLLFICSCTYLRAARPSLFREKRPG